MSKKTLMGAVVSHMIRELTPDLPADANTEVENEVVNKMRSILGDNWASLPVSGPYMMVAVLTMNYILLPMGITPISIADKAITKGKEYRLDTKFEDLLCSAKATANSTGEFTSEKIKELTAYSEEKGKIVEEVIHNMVKSSQELGKSVLTRGKSMGKNLIGSIKHQLNDDNPEDDQSTQ